VIEYIVTDENTADATASFLSHDGDTLGGLWVVLFPIDPSPVFVCF
jgi:hypothetical protein